MATLQESVLAPACVSSVAFHLPSVAPVWIKMENIFLHGHQTSAAAAASAFQLYSRHCVCKMWKHVQQIRLKQTKKKMSTQGT